MVPVFSLVLDRDVDENLALLYPELYKELTLGKTLSYKTFLVWVLISIYQGTPSLITPTDLRLCDYDSEQYSRRYSTGISIATSSRFIHRVNRERIGHDRSGNQYLAQVHDTWGTCKLCLLRNLSALPRRLFWYTPPFVEFADGRCLV